MGRSPWPDELSHLAFSLFRKKVNSEEIGRRLKRSPQAVRQHLLKRYGVSFNTNVVRASYANPMTIRLVPSVLEERERVYAHDETLNQHFFGDPLPGRSALDRKRAGEARS